MSDQELMMVQSEENVVNNPDIGESIPSVQVEKTEAVALNPDSEQEFPNQVPSNQLEGDGSQVQKESKELHEKHPHKKEWKKPNKYGKNNYKDNKKQKDKDEKYPPLDAKTLKSSLILTGFETLLEVNSIGEKVVPVRIELPGVIVFANLNAQSFRRIQRNFRAMTEAGESFSVIMTGAFNLQTRYLEAAGLQLVQRRKDKPASSDENNVDNDELFLTDQNSVAIELNNAAENSLSELSTDIEKGESMPLKHLEDIPQNQMNNNLLIESNVNSISLKEEIKALPQQEVSEDVPIINMAAVDEVVVQTISQS